MNPVTPENIKIKVSNLNFFYRRQLILSNISAEFEEKSITAIVGPSGIGKSTFLMTLNRLWEDLPEARMRGTVEIKLGGRFQNIYAPSFSLPRLRRAVGMVFQTPNPLPMSIFRNVAFPLKLAGCRDKKMIEEKVEAALQKTCLWNEVKDRLKEKAFSLSGGQQQRLCLARALISEPEVLLLDEPASSLDAKTAAVIEELLLSLKQHCTVILVSHYMDQIRKIADQIVRITEPDKNGEQKYELNQTG
ncbi:MAG: ATP-binding cassette domain-containing protein [Desulfobacterales bacterium]